MTLTTISKSGQVPKLKGHLLKYLQITTKEIFEGIKLTSFVENEYVFFTIYVNLHRQSYKIVAMKTWQCCWKNSLEIMALKIKLLI